jgi:Fic family protein
MPSKRAPTKAAATKSSSVSRIRVEPTAKKRPAPSPPVEAPKVLTIEERTASLEARLMRADAEFQAKYRETLDMSWIYHDSAIEGVVYTFQELRAALDPNAPVEVAPDSSLQPVCEEIRRHREALDYVRDYAIKRRLPITLDVVKKIYLILHPEEGDLKSVKYRKDIPQHRLYFHEYAAPDKIAYKVRQVVDWVNDPETRRTRNAMRVAARAHYDLLRVFPFAHDSGKVARLFMNLLLLRSGYPPAIVHSTERQRYYEALKGANPVMNQIVQEAIENNLASIEKMLDGYEAAREGRPAPNPTSAPAVSNGSAASSAGQAGHGAHSSHPSPASSASDVSSHGSSSSGPGAASDSSSAALDE